MLPQRLDQFRGVETEQAPRSERFLVVLAVNKSGVWTGAAVAYVPIIYPETAALHCLKPCYYRLVDFQLFIPRLVVVAYERIPPIPLPFSLHAVEFKMYQPAQNSGTLQRKKVYSIMKLRYAANFRGRLHGSYHRYSGRVTRRDERSENVRGTFGMQMCQRLAFRRALCFLC